MPAESLPEDHPGWDLQARYIALALVNQICMISPQRVVLGGGVMKHRELFPLVREKVRSYLNGYIAMDEVQAGIDHYIVPPLLDDRSGCLGAIGLAQHNSKNLASG